MPQSPRRLKQQVRDTVGEQIRDLPINAARLAMFGVGRALLLSDRMTKDVKEMRESGVLPVLDRLRGDVQHATTKTAGKVVGMVIERIGGADELEEEPVRPGPARATTTAGTTEAPPARRVNTSLAAGGEISVGKPAPNGRSAGPAVARPAPKPAATKPAAKPATPLAPKPAAAQAPAAPAAEVKPAAKPVAKPAAKPAAEPKAAAPAAASLPVPDYDAASVPALRARLRGLTVEQVGKLLDYERANAARPDVVRMYENRIAKLTEQA